jgi:hypothetical protein
VCVRRVRGVVSTRVRARMCCSGLCPVLSPVPPCAASTGPSQTRPGNRAAGASGPAPTSSVSEPAFFVALCRTLAARFPGLGPAAAPAALAAELHRGRLAADDARQAALAVPRAVTGLAGHGDSGGPGTGHGDRRGPRRAHVKSRAGSTLTASAAAAVAAAAAAAATAAVEEVTFADGRLHASLAALTILRWPAGRSGVGPDAASNATAGAPSSSSSSAAAAPVSASSSSSSTPASAVGAVPADGHGGTGGTEGSAGAPAVVVGAPSPVEGEAVGATPSTAFPSPEGAGPVGSGTEGDGGGHHPSDGPRTVAASTVAGSGVDAGTDADGGTPHGGPAPGPAAAAVAPPSAPTRTVPLLDVAAVLVARAAAGWRVAVPSPADWAAVRGGAPVAALPLLAGCDLLLESAWAVPFVTDALLPAVLGLLGACATRVQRTFRAFRELPEARAGGLGGASPAPPHPACVGRVLTGLHRQAVARGWGRWKGVGLVCGSRGAGCVLRVWGGE